MTDSRRGRRGEARGGSDEAGRGRAAEESRGGGAGGITPTGEWVVAAIGALLVLGVMASMLREALDGPVPPPAIEIEVDTVAATEFGWVVEFRARNHGGRTAAGLVVEGELLEGGRTIQRSRATLDYVPAEGSRRAGLLFSRDPRRYRLELRALGYDRP